MVFTFIMLAILVFLVLIGWFIRLRQGRRQHVTHLDRHPHGGGVATQTERHLIRLSNGDRKGALRLVAKVREDNPGRSEQWCWEKVIYDLERDRRI